MLLEYVIPHTPVKHGSSVTKEGPGGRDSVHPVVSGGQWEETVLPLSTVIVQCARGKCLGTTSIQAMLPRALLQTFCGSRTSMHHSGKDRDEALYALE